MAERVLKQDKTAERLCLIVEKVADLAKFWFTGESFPLRKMSRDHPLLLETN